MKTDSLIHRFFREFTGAFFTLLGEEERQAEHYEFTAVEVKEQAFRFDGVFKPDSRTPPLYFFEAQFGPEDDFYLRFFGEVAVYLRQKNPPNPWRGVVLFLDPGIHPHYQEFFESGRIRRLHLSALPESMLEKFPLNLLRIILVSEQAALETANDIVRQFPPQYLGQKEQEVIIDLLINLLLSKLPQMSRKEIEKMLEPILSDIRKSRFYQEVAEELTQELMPKLTQELTPKLTQELTPKLTQELTPKLTQELTPKIKQESKLEEKREIAKTMLRKNFELELISEVTGLSLEQILALKD